MSNFIQYSNRETWGRSIVVLEENGRGTFVLYGYQNDDTTDYLAKMYVVPAYRQRGIGTTMLKMAEKISLATYLCLSAELGTWIHSWYLRQGYSDWKENEEGENLIWMRKTIRNTV